MTIRWTRHFIMWAACFIVSFQAFESRVIAQTFDDWRHHVRVSIDSTAYLLQDTTVFVLRTDNWVPIAKLPALTYRTLLQYHPNVLRRYNTDSIPKSIDEYPQLSQTSVEAAFVFDGRIWAGLYTYNSEGFEGLGGIAYWDSRTGKVGVLRHPALIDFSSTDIFATDDTVYVKSVWNGELASGVGNGLVAISRKTLNATARIPPGNLGLQDKDDPSVSNPVFELPLPQLVRRRDFIGIRTAKWSVRDSLLIHNLGADRYMEQVALEELSTAP